MVDVAKIPSIMRAQTPPWDNAARLQDIWFAGPAAAVKPAYASPDTTTLKMDSWLLTFARARHIYDSEIVATEYWKTPAAEASLRRKIEKSGILAGGPQRFGGLGRPVEVQDPEHYQGKPVSSSLLSDPLDDLFGALGDYNLRFVAEGQAEPLGGTDWLVTVERVGIYIEDSFDFNGFQPLGFWNETKNQVSKSPGFGFDLVTNGDYRAWRAAHGSGGDFLVFSDVKIIAEAKPWSFHATGAVGTPSSPQTPAAGPPVQPPSAAPPGAEVTVARGDTLSGLAQRHYGDWRLWPLIWDQNRAAVGPNPSMLRIGTRLRLAPSASFSSLQVNDAHRRAPKWKNNEIP
jgi:hypothetical protein